MFKRRKPEDQITDEPAGGGTPFPAIPVPEGASQRSGLGMPPYRPAPPAAAPVRSSPIASVTSQDSLAMGRAPFPAPPSPTSPPAPRPGTAIPPGPGAAQVNGAPGAVTAKEAPEKRTLVVGRGISVQGTVQDAERLVVEGTVEASMIHAAELHVAPGGMFRGEVQVQDAEVAGTIDGTLTASGNLIIRASGRLLGTAKCRRLQVEDGGQVTGRLEMLPDQATQVAAPADPFRAAPLLSEAIQPETVPVP